MGFIERLNAHLYSKHSLWNLPNLLTLLRILLIPVMGMLLAFDSDQPPFDKDWMFRYSPGRVAAGVLLIMGITDLLDGYLARLWKTESLLGKFLDPLADKLVLLVGLIMLLQLERVPAWLVIILLTREFLVTGLRAIAVGEGIVIAAGGSGKLKLIFQMVGLGFLMWYGSAFNLPAVKIGTGILYIALLISVGSGIQYLVDFFRGLSAKRPSL
ncbi:CDP-diacylglycerol--glycerol-3-phosphate 3-phosphatidyltransferase [bacterium]|nr:CDP-diacylglycerol--glycerol-3-phosphate 3-phosphatidyltransferase [bacterium]